ncbi:MAG: DUF839 domain-containing protein, partial [Flavobacteriales bacterium]|nr:DUF839 domain-containing protein [Flavobacteriales bacterium]
MKYSLLILIGSLLYSCSSETKQESIANDSPFIPVESNFTTTDLLLPEGFTYKILFQAEENKVVRKDGKRFPAKGSHDVSVFIPDSVSPETKGILYIGHEGGNVSELGDGGGATVADLELVNGSWEVTSDFHNVDFSTVGGTLWNCGGSLTTNGTVLTCEEVCEPANETMYSSQDKNRDTTRFNNRPLWQNMGYIVEVDPVNKEAITKHWKMGRFVHEDALTTEDGKTVYLTNDNYPAVFFKFETAIPFDYSDGTLYAYQQSKDGESGTWLTMPMDTLSLLFANKTALELGATRFIRHEWIEEINDKFYITETGADQIDWSDYENNDQRVAK